MTANLLPFGSHGAFSHSTARPWGSLGCDWRVDGAAQRSYGELAERLANGLCPAWQRVVGEEGPDCGVIRPEVMIEPSQLIFPRRHLYAVDPPQAPPETHIYRALNSLPPERVAVMFMGQDPFPRPCRATGRSFEAGDRNDWHRVGGITALRRICQQLAAYRTADPRYQQIDKWQCLKKAIERRTVRIPCIRQTLTIGRVQASFC